MKKISIITVQNIDISISTENNVDYICLTDMVKGQEGEDHIRNWMRNRNTLEFLGAWEMLHNPTFKGVEFDTFLHEAGANRFNMTPRKWIEATDAIGMISKAGRNGGTYAHKDIAFEFGSWLSPVFKLYLITEYQRLNKILITGANGYLGAQISKYLVREGYSVSGLCFPEIPNDENWRMGFENLFLCDIRNVDKLREIAENQFDAIIHLVSLDHHQSNGDVNFVTSINVSPTWNLLDIFGKKGLKKFIFFSTIHVYGKNLNGNIDENFPVNCANFYALTHYLSENICRYYAQNSNVNCVVARLSNSYCEPILAENNCWWLVVNDLCKAAFFDKKIALQSDGSPLRDFINGQDVCRAVKTLIDKGENGKTYHISSGETFSILQLAEKVQSVYEKRFGEKLPIFKAESANSVIPKYKIDNSALKSIGFQPEISIEKGIENLFNYFEKK